MANLISLATGNFSAAGSWGVADTTMLKLDGTTSTAVTTGNLDSGAFTPGVITVDGILLNISRRIVSPTGTLTVTLRNSTAGADVTSVTVNVSDLPAMENAAVAPGGWVFFKFGSSQLLLAATNYVVRLTSSVGSEVFFYAGASNAWNLALRTTTTGAPAANDRMFITREYTGAGTSNAITITMDTNATTDFGKIDVTSATFIYSIAANTQLRASGFLDVWAGATFNMGTVANPVPSGITAILEFDCTSNGEFGLRIQKGATFTAQGANKVYPWVKLAADAAAGATSLTVDTSVGTNWKNGDVCCLASTTRTNTEAESKALTADGSGTTLTITALANTHGGTAGAVQGEIGNLTRNVIIRPVGASSTYIDFQTSSTVDMDWTEITNVGVNTTNPGINIRTTTGTCNIQYCSIHDCTVTTSASTVTLNNGSGTGVTFSNNIIYQVVSRHMEVVSTTDVSVVSGNLFCRSTGGTSGVLLTDSGTTFTNNVVTSMTNFGLIIGTTDALGTMSGNISHSNGSTGIVFNGATPGTMSSTTVWRNNGAGITIGVSNGNFGTLGSELLLDGVTAFGNVGSAINFSNDTFFAVRINNLVSNGGVTLVQTSGIVFSDDVTDLEITNSTFGVTTDHTTGDLTVSSGVQMVTLRNCLLDSATELSGQTSMYPGNTFIRSSKHDQVAGAYKAWFRYGTIENDTVTFNTAAPSEKMTPNNASFKLKSAIKSVALNSGQTATVSVYLRKTAAGANQPRLIVKRNDSAGITSDTVLDTMSVGINTWEQLSGTTGAVTENCVLEFYVDSDNGNTVVYTDDWAVTLA